MVRDYGLRTLSCRWLCPGQLMKPRQTIIKNGYHIAAHLNAGVILRGGDSVPLGNVPSRASSHGPVLTQCCLLSSERDKNKNKTKKHRRGLKWLWSGRKRIEPVWLWPPNVNHPFTPTHPLPTPPNPLETHAHHSLSLPVILYLLISSLARINC